MPNAFGITLEPLPTPSWPIQAQLRKLHKLDFMETVAVRRTATLIGEWELTATDFDAGLKQFKELLQSLHHFAMSERNSWMLHLCKGVSIALGHFLAGRLQLSYDNVERLSQLSKPVHGRQGVEHFGLFYSEVLGYLFNSYKTRYNTAVVLGQLSEEDLSHFDDFRQPDEVEEAIQSLLTGIAELCRYGVKPCTMQDGLLHDPDFAWVMNDGADIMSFLLPDGVELARIDPPLAVTMLARRSAIKILKPTLRKEKIGITPFRSLSFDFNSYTSANLYLDGRVTLEVGWGMIPLQGVFAEAGVGELYELFHLLQLLRVYDLVVPVELAESRRVPAWPVRRRRQSIDPESTEPTWRQLVVPRIRMLRDLEGLASGIEREIAEDLAFTRQYGGGIRESREIQGFLRRIRAGRQATDRARQFAWEERGWEIPEGYTYVKKHDWGTGPNRTAGHEAVRRSI